MIRHIAGRRGTPVRRRGHHRHPGGGGGVAGGDDQAVRGVRVGVDDLDGDLGSGRDDDTGQIQPVFDGF
jgi:hypothetical protein